MSDFLGFCRQPQQAKTDSGDTSAQSGKAHRVSDEVS